MVKNKLIKNITTDELATIINNGFEGQMAYELATIINNGFEGQMAYMEKKFAEVATKQELVEVEKRLGGRLHNVEKRLCEVEEGLGEVKKVLTDAHVL